jgi:hypothetical protein
MQSPIVSPFVRFLGKRDVVVLAGVEGRVEVDEVHGLVLDIAAQDVEVIAVIKVIFGHCCGKFSTDSACRLNREKQVVFGMSC